MFGNVGSVGAKNLSLDLEELGEVLFISKSRRPCIYPESEYKAGF